MTSSNFQTILEYRPINWHLATLFILLSILMQSAYLAGTWLYHQDVQKQSIATIEKRVALDLPKLKLANNRFNTVAHRPSVERYLNRLNSSLSQQQSRFRVKRLQQVKVKSDFAGSSVTTELSTPDQRIELEIIGIDSPAYFSWLPILIAALLTYISRIVFSHKAMLTQQSVRVITPSAPKKLIIDLHSKTLKNSINQKAIHLANKPFCFYTALVDYCLKEEEPYLNPSKEVPLEIVDLANNYFYRLISLGHTKRKKPDFSTNLDKTLSEIRAALDEVYLEQPEIKQIFYPPKAQGEGSRSRKHNYALGQLKPEQVEIIGR